MRWSVGESGRGNVGVRVRMFVSILGVKGVGVTRGLADEKRGSFCDNKRKAMSGYLRECWSTNSSVCSRVRE